jgi:hypothetical protein
MVLTHLKCQFLKKGGLNWKRKRKKRGSVKIKSHHIFQSLNGAFFPIKPLQMKVCSVLSAASQARVLCCDSVPIMRHTRNKEKEREDSPGQDLKRE